MEETQPSDVPGEGNKRFSPEHLHGNGLGVMGLAWIKLDGKAERLRGDGYDIPGSHATRSSRNRETTDLSSVKKLPLADPLVHPPKKPVFVGETQLGSSTCIRSPPPRPHLLRHRKSDTWRTKSP